MDLENTTVLDAHVVVVAIQKDTARAGLVTAKATFKVSSAGVVTLDGSDPVALFDADEETELGLLPNDLEPREDGSFEVITLGVAHAPNGQPVEKQEVVLAVGDVERRLMVHGDRIWEDRLASRATPFTQMPLTFQRAHGGTAEVWIDQKSAVDISDRLNPEGRGFDPMPLLTMMPEAFGCPSGFPRLTDPVRVLPNLEHPAAPIVSPEQSPEPYCWATIPRSIGFAAITQIRAMEQGIDPDPETMKVEVAANIYRRAHPDWRMPIPKHGARVRMEGLTPAGDLEFSLPTMGVVADYSVAGRTGELDLVPSTLVLLPNENRFYIVYRAKFHTEKNAEDEASLRLRIVNAPPIDNEASPVSPAGPPSLLQ